MTKISTINATLPYIQAYFILVESLLFKTQDFKVGIDTLSCHKSEIKVPICHNTKKFTEIIEHSLRKMIAELV